MKQEIESKKEIIIKLNTIDRAKTFVDRVQAIPNEMYLKSDSIKVDAKSIMGLFSLNLLHPMKLIVMATNDQIIEIETTIKEFMI